MRLSLSGKVDRVTATEFPELFPGVRHAQVKAALEFAAKHSLTAT